MDKDNLYFLKISGNVSSGKHREFQQTVQFIFNHLPIGCLGRNLALDVHHPNLYHLFSLWQSEAALLIFKSSHEFELLKGAYHTLGEYEDTMAGRIAEAQLFELNNLEA